MRELHSLVHKLLVQADSNRALQKKARTVLKKLLESESVPANDSGALRQFEPLAFVQEHGLLALRDYLERFSADDLKSFVRHKKLAADGVSKLAKAQVINRIIMAAKTAA